MTTATATATATPVSAPPVTPFAKPPTHATSGTDPTLSLGYPDGSLIVRAKSIPWTPWGMPGTQFKLLHCDDAQSLLVILLKVEPGRLCASSQCSSLNCVPGMPHGVHGMLLARTISEPSG